MPKILAFVLAACMFFVGLGGGWATFRWMGSVGGATRNAETATELVDSVIRLAGGYYFEDAWSGVLNPPVSYAEDPRPYLGLPADCVIDQDRQPVEVPRGDGWDVTMPLECEYTQGVDELTLTVMPDPGNPELKGILLSG